MCWGISEEFAELEQLPDSFGFHYELRRGELVEVAPPKDKHYQLQRRIRKLLESVAGDHGEVDIEWGFRGLPEHEYREADVAFVSRERAARISPESNLEGAPDIVIEALSRSTTAAEMLDKEQLCLENGAQEFWIVDPVRKVVRVSSREGRVRTYKPGEAMLSCSAAHSPWTPSSLETK